MDRHTPVKTLPFHRTTYAGGKKEKHAGFESCKSYISKNVLMVRLKITRVYEGKISICPLCAGLFKHASFDAEWNFTGFAQRK